MANLTKRNRCTLSITLAILLAFPAVPFPTVSAAPGGAVGYDAARAKQEYRIFFGLDDPKHENQTIRRIDLCHEFEEIIRKWHASGRLDPSDPTAGRLGALQHTAAALFFGTDLGTLLRDRGAPEELALDGNYYAKVTLEAEKRLLASILASRGNITPAALMHLALQATNGNYTLATLTAHNFLKNAAYKGRGHALHSKQEMNLMEMKNNGNDHLIPLSQKLVNLRGDPGKGDKFGPWYHMFGILFIGSVTNRVVAESMAVAEQFSRHLLTEQLGITSYSPVDREKADWDECAMRAMRGLHPVIYSGNPPPPRGPEPQLPSEPKRLVLLSATVTPAQGKPGDEFALHLQYGVEGAAADAAVSVNEQVRLSGPTPLALPGKTRIVDKQRIVRATYTGRFQTPGDYQWQFSVTAPEHEALTGQAAFRVTAQATAVTRSLLFLIDTSGSMSGAKLENAKKAAANVALARAGQTAAEEWALLSFSEHNVFVQQPFTTNAQLIAAATQRLSASGDTPLAWAVAQALIYLNLNANGQTGQIIVLSDGQEACNERSPGGGKRAISTLNRVLQNLQLTHAAPSPQRSHQSFARVSSQRDSPILLHNLAFTDSDAPRFMLAQATGAPQVLGQPGQTVDDALGQLERDLRQTNRRTSISIVGFGVDAATTEELRSITEASGGAYLPAERADELETALGQAATGTRRGSLGILARPDPKAGVQVLWIEHNSPSQGLLLPGDFITAANNVPVTSIQQLTAFLSGQSAGTNVNFTVIRNKTAQTVSVPLGNPLPPLQRTMVIAGGFRGESFAGTFIGYLDPNRRTGWGTMEGVGGSSLKGTFNGTWNPETGEAHLPFEATVRVIFKFGTKGVISGRVDRTGRGSGTFEGKGAIGTERGAWQCQPYDPQSIMAF